MEKKIKRYVFYALGEILLVMIGILLALQVNNWNEKRKSEILEVQLLREIKSGLTSDLADIDYNIESHQKILRSQKIILEWMESDTPYFDSLSHHFSIINGSTVFVANSSPYATLKDIGIRIISNGALRDKITSVYDLDFDYYLDHVQLYNEMVVYGWKEVNEHYFEGTRFKFSNPEITMTPSDISKIKNDNKYRYYINTLVDLNDFHVNKIMKKAQRSAAELIDMINTELQNRE